MKTATLIRNQSTEKQTTGRLILGLAQGKTFEAKSLELPWKDNAPNISCIPPGKYTCRYTVSARLSSEAEKRYLKSHGTPSATRILVSTYQVLAVKDRTGIRIHSANYFFQLLGCIAIGAEHKDINIDGNLDVIHSGSTISAFERLMNYEDFILTIY